MQHHGTPTRLLDWSYSLFIATYFAVESGKGPSAVWALSTKWIHKEAESVVPKYWLDEYDKKRDDKAFKRLFMPDRLNPLEMPKKFIATVNPHVLNKRLSVQQGLFLAVGDVTQSFKDTLPQSQSKPPSLVKLIIDQKVGREILKLLYDMGISRASLYPGLDGFAWSLRTKTHALRDKI